MMLSVQTPAAQRYLPERAHRRSQVCTDTQSQIGRAISSNLANLTRVAACVRTRRGTAIATARLAASTPAALVASAARRHLARVGGPGRPGRHRSPSRRFLLGAQPCIGWVRSSRPHRSATRERVGHRIRPERPRVGQRQSNRPVDALRWARRQAGAGGHNSAPDGWRCDRRTPTSTLRSKHDVDSCSVQSKHWTRSASLVQSFEVPRQEWFACPRCVTAVRTRAHTWASLRRRGCCLHLRTG